MRTFCLWLFIALLPLRVWAGMGVTWPQDSLPASTSHSNVAHHAGACHQNKAEAQVGPDTGTTNELAGHTCMSCDVCHSAPYLTSAHALAGPLTPQAAPAHTPQAWSAAVPQPSYKPPIL